MSTKHLLRRRTRVRNSAAAVAALAITVSVAACGSSTPAASPAANDVSAAPAAASGQDPTLAAMVPAAIRQKGTLTVAANATYPPDEFFASDNTTITGFDPDLAGAVGQILGLKLNFVNTKFAEIIPGLQAGHFDLGWSSATATEARQKVVNFVTYFQAGIGFLVPSDSTLTINGLSDLCGLQVAVEAGSAEDKTATEQSAKCTAAGNKAISIQRYQDENQNLLALSSGRAQVSTAGSQIIPYLVQQSNGKLKSVGTAYNMAPLGVEFPKSTPIELAKAFQGALNKMISDGTYGQILAKWNEQVGAIQNSEILPAPSS